MWPWEHALFGYLVYSLFCRAYFREPPGEGEALLVVFGSVLPDLIDKPLAWEFGVFPSGYALAHSIFFAVPLAIAAGLLGRALGDARAGLAFGVGYLLHLVGDVIPIYVRTGEVRFDHLLWPVVVVETHSLPPGLIGGIQGNLDPYLDELLSSEPSTYVLLQIGIAVGAFLLWLVDGMPGLRGLYGGVRRTVSAVARFT